MGERATRPTTSPVLRYQHNAETAGYTLSSSGPSPELLREVARSASFESIPGIRVGAIRLEKQSPIDAIPTGFPTWSLCCRDAGGGIGLGRGWHIVIAGRSGLGKSILALNIALEAARNGEQVYFLSLEMSGIQVETRFLAMAGNVPVSKLEQGRGFDVGALDEAADRLADQIGERGSFQVNREPLRDLDDVIETMQWAYAKRGARFYVVDYLQLAAADPNEASCVAEVSHEVRRFAQENNVITIAVSQFNRPTSSSKEKPTMFGLMGSSSIENDADQIVLLDHSRKEPAPAPLDAWNSFLLLDKNRHGPTGEIPIQFNKRTLRITERMPDELEGR